MCDVMSAIGIIRVHQFGLKIDHPFFVRAAFPIENDSYEYHIKKTVSTINFIIEVLLKYKDLMLTNTGIEEANKRHQIIIDFLYQYFDEEDAPEWTKFLNRYLDNK